MVNEIFSVTVNCNHVEVWRMRIAEAEPVEEAKDSSLSDTGLTVVKAGLFKFSLNQTVNTYLGDWSQNKAFQIFSELNSDHMY